MLDIDYTKYNFHDSDANYQSKFPPGLNREVVERISKLKKEPDWMLQFRLRAYDHFTKRPLPMWGGDLTHLNFDQMIYYASSTEKNSRSWDEVPEYIKNTFDKLGIPEAERKFLGGVGAQYESEVVYHSLREDLAKKGIIFTDTDTALREYPEIFKKYFGTVIPPEDNKFAALNSAVWSGGSFIYVPKGVTVGMPLQAYFRINVKNMGQFERTLIIADENSHVQYVEGCLPAHEQISTGKAWVNIEQVRPGDRVLNSDGKKAIVRAVRTRHYVGDLVTIRPLSKGNTFQLTPEHPVLIVPRSEVLVRRKPRGTWLPEVNPLLLQKSQAKFVEAQHLHRGDFLVFPISKITRDDAHYTVPVLRLLGYYLAEGSTYIHRKLHLPVVSFAFGIQERRRVGEVKQLVKQVTGKTTYEVPDRKKNGTNLIVYSKELRELCLKSCGKIANTKQLSKKIMELPPAKQAHLLQTYMGGDGSTYQRLNSMVRASTASATLAHQLQELLSRQGQYATISVRKGGEDTIMGRRIVRKDQYILYYSPDKDKSKVRRKGNLFLVPIKELHRDSYNGFVFNLELDHAPNAYLTRGFAVHNCTAPIYSTDSLHSAVVEIIARPGAHVRYTTIQNWSNDVYNLVTKRAYAYQNASVEWVDGNLGCVKEGEDVYTEYGPKPIETIEPGSHVWSLDEDHKWKLHRVVARRNSGLQQVYSVKFTNGRTINLTQNHPLLAIQYDKTKPRKLGRYTLSWLHLKDLKRGDCVVFPKKLNSEGEAYRFVRPSMRNNFIGRNQYGATYKMKSHARRMLHLPISADEHICWLLGLWLAEGDYSISNGENGLPRYGRVGWSVPKRDRARKPLMNLLNKYADEYRVDERKDGVYFRINSLELALWLKANGFISGSKNKTLPDWVFGLSLRMRLAIIAGYLNGDGCADKTSLTVKSASRKLLIGLQMLATLCGLHAGGVSTHREKLDPNHTGKVKTYTINRLHLTNLLSLRQFLSRAMQSKYVGTRKPWRYHKVGKIRPSKLLTEDMGLTQIRSITPSATEHTYDLEINGAHSFIVNGILVHNSKLTMKYPSIYLVGPGAKGEILSVAFAGKGQHQDSGGKVVHLAPNTTSRITSKSISKDGGRTTYRGLLHVGKGATGVKSTVRCDALLLDEISRTDTYPYNEINEQDATTTHEATVGKIGEDQLFYLMSRGLSEQEALSMIVMGFMEPFTKELPMEYAIELNRLIQLEMAGAVG